MPLVIVAVATSPAESVVVTTTTGANGAPGVGRRASIPESRAAIWDDHSVGRTEVNHAGALSAKKADFINAAGSPVTDAAAAAVLTLDARSAKMLEGMYAAMSWPAAAVNCSALPACRFSAAKAVELRRARVMTEERMLQEMI